MPASSRVPAGFSSEQMKAIRLLKRRHRLCAIERVFGWSDGYACKLKRMAKERGHKFPASADLAPPLTVKEYEAACRDARILPNPQVVQKLVAAPMEGNDAWPHLRSYPSVASPRNAAAGAQAARILERTQAMRHVPASAAGGGHWHFGRECAEHLAQLIAYAPGPRYPDDPRALRPEARFVPDFHEIFSITPSALGQFAEVAS